MKPLSDTQNAKFLLYLGKRVTKNSGKPFKSGDKVGTVKGIELHPQTGHLGFTFLEDDTIVECWRCELYEPELDTKIGGTI